MAKLNKIRITQIKSGIGYRTKAKATLKALGFRKMQQAVDHNDTPVIRGMINVIPFLLKVEDL